jgi:hypothetical protein
MSQSKHFAINEPYDYLIQAYTSLPGMDGYNGLFNAADDDWKRRVDDANGAGTSDNIQRIFPYSQTDGPEDGPQLVCGYVGETVPVSPGQGGTIINTTALKCIAAGEKEWWDPDSYRIVRNYTWDQGKCAFVDDITGEYSDALKNKMLPNHYHITDSRFPKNLMRHCPASVQVIDNYDRPDLIDLSDQKNYESDIQLTKEMSGKGRSQIRYNDETYTCIPSLMWNQAARDTQPVVDAEELSCCKGQYNYDVKRWGAACQGRLRLKLVDGVYQAQS